MITPEEAVAAARRELVAAGIDPGERESEVSQPGQYQVVFLLPEGRLGGDWTVMVDGDTGEATIKEIQR
jgi:hypothetical protein